MSDIRFRRPNICGLVLVETHEKLHKLPVDAIYVQTFSPKWHCTPIVKFPNELVRGAGSRWFELVRGADSSWFALVRATRTPYSDSGGEFRVHFRIRREKLLLEVYYGGHRSIFLKPDRPYSDPKS